MYKKKKGRVSHSCFTSLAYYLWFSKKKKRKKIGNKWIRSFILSKKIYVLYLQKRNYFFKNEFLPESTLFYNVIILWKLINLILKFKKKKEKLRLEK